MPRTIRYSAILQAHRAVAFHMLQLMILSGKGGRCGRVALRIGGALIEPYEASPAGPTRLRDRTTKIGIVRIRVQMHITCEITYPDVQGKRCNAVQLGAAEQFTRLAK